MTFINWLDTLVEEKGLDRSHVFPVQGGAWGTNWIPLECIINALKAAPESVQSKAKDILISIDFMDGDVMHFFNHLAMGMAL